ncbi:MAG: hypothetical protein RIC95_12445 [Vicingaceae bacterium]
MEKQCLQCGEELIGRIDKKFCSDQCRNTFNNSLKSKENTYIRKVNSILRKNRRVLSIYNPSGKSKVHRDNLLKGGFNFDYHTDTYTNKENKTYYYCYEHGYLELDNGWYALVRKKPFINKA